MNEKEENNGSIDEKNLKKNNDSEEKKIILNDQLDSQKKKLEKDLKEELILKLEKKIESIKNRERDSILRLKAEIENIRKRNEKEIIKTHKFALESFVGDLLPVIDNLERTLNIIHQSNDKLDVIIKGLELTLKSFLNTIKKFGVDVIEQINVPFNPGIHQAMTMSTSDICKPNHIIKILQKGYILNGRLIRPAMVTVSIEKDAVVE